MEKRAPYDCNRVLKITPQNNGKNQGGDKETIGTWTFIAPNPRFDPEYKYSHRYARPITIRVYMARAASASVVYASIWANSRDGELSTAGNGSAGGYGYDKESAAIDDAFESAGIEMQKHFGGCGESCVKIAIESLAKRLGWKTGQVMRF